MTRTDRFFGAILIIATALLWLNSAAETFLKAPGLFSAIVAACVVSAGFAACSSIWRDRL